MDIKDIYESKLFEEAGTRKCWHEFEEIKNKEHEKLKLALKCSTDVEKLTNLDIRFKCKKCSIESRPIDSFRYSEQNPSPNWQFFGECIEQLEKKKWLEDFGAYFALTITIEKHGRKGIAIETWSKFYNLELFFSTLDSFLREVE